MSLAPRASLSRHRRRLAALLACAALGAGVLAGCGDDDSDKPSAAGASASASDSASASASPTTPAPQASDTPATTLPGDISTRTTTSVAPVPSGGPKRIANFPVPRGYAIKGPAPQAESWQFDVITKSPGSVLAFYRKALAADGYQVRNDVDETVGAEDVHYDIAFTGPAVGYIVNDTESGSVFVEVSSLPDR